MHDSALHRSALMRTYNSSIAPSARRVFASWHPGIPCASVDHVCIADPWRSVHPPSCMRLALLLFAIPARLRERPTSAQLTCRNSFLLGAGCIARSRLHSETALPVAVVTGPRPHAARDSNAVRSTASACLQSQNAPCGGFPLPGATGGVRRMVLLPLQPRPWPLAPP